MQREVPAAVLAEIAVAASNDSGGVPPEYLGEFLAVLVGAVESGTALGAPAVRACRRHGDRAATRGVALRALLDLYLSAAWRLWRHLPAVTNARRRPAGVVAAGEVMLRATDDAVAALTEGFQLARRSLVRAQEAARREFVDDLLTGSSDVTGLLHRGVGFGLDLSAPHAVATVRARRPFDDASPSLRSVERAVSGSKADAPPLLATKNGDLVVVFAAPDALAVQQVVDGMSAVLSTPRTAAAIGAWRAGVGRPAVGADGVMTSFREAADVLGIAERLGLPGSVADARDLLAYRLLLRDRAALGDLVQSTLGPLRAARAGAGPLVETLACWYATGGNATRTAAQLHLSVRAVTYRLGRIHALTGLDPERDRFSLYAAALGAQLLDWPTGFDG